MAPIDTDRTRLADRNWFFWLFFQFDGRISRVAYLLAGLFLFDIQFLILFQVMKAPPESAAAANWAFAFILVLLVSLWCQFAHCAKRLHDIGKSGWYGLLLLVPFVSLLVFIALCFIPGAPGLNRFGSRTNAPG